MGGIYYGLNTGGEKVLGRTYQWSIRLGFGVALTFFALASLFYTRLPERIPIQFAFDWTVSNWGNKIMNFTLPAIVLILAGAGYGKNKEWEVSATAGQKRINQVALIACQLFVWCMGAYIFFLYARLLE